MTVRTVTAADTRFLLREEGSGSGTPVLLLHGVPETSSVWRDVAPKLATGRRVLAPDLPGLGGSSYAGPFDVPSLVDQIAALIESEAPGAVDVVGHDWGGSLALGLAGQRPELVRRLVVANAPFRHVPLHRALHIPLFALPAVPELIFRLGGRRVVDTMLALAWKSSTPLDEDRRAEYEAAYTDPEKVSAMLAYYRAAARPRVKALLTRTALEGSPRVKVDKSLVLWGALDPVLPIGTGESVVRDLGADCVMVTVPGAGHFVIEEATAVVTDVLLDFLRDEPAKPPSTKAAVKKAAPKKVAAKKAAPKTSTSAPEAPPSPGSR
jgi:pimeloyl-ACP methyl ester carboxylesterase